MQGKRAKGKHIYLKNVLISLLIICFFVGIVVAYYYMLIDEKKSNIVMEGQMLSKQVEAEIDQYLEAATDGLKLAAYTIESMLESHESHEAILDQLTEQSTAVEKAVFVDTTGLYGYIDGEYLDGAGWVPDDDYEPTTRPWYTETIANGNEITTIEPYVDSLTGGIIMSFAKTLKDGKSVVSIDFDMARIQEIIEEYSSSDDNNTQIILDNNNLIIAHSDKDEVGKIFGEDKNTLDGDVLKKIDRTSKEFFELDYDHTKYVIHQRRMTNGLRYLSIDDATDTFRPLRILLTVTLAVVFVIVLILATILYRSGQRSLVAENLNSQLSSAVEIYHSVFDIDVYNGGFSNIRSADSAVTDILGTDVTDTQEAFNMVLSQISDPESRDEILRFADISTLNQRMRNHRVITKEFLSITKHWFRARFIVSNRMLDGQLSHVLWVVEDIDEEKRQRDALFEIVTKMNEQVSSVANIYFSMYDIDLTNDTLLEVRTNPQDVSKTTDDNIEHAQEVLSAIMDETANDISKEVINEFIDLSTINYRMLNTNTITEEFLSSKDIWCRTRFVVSKRDVDGTIEHVLWLVEGIDEEKRRRDRLIDMSERAIAASEAKSSFLSNMSHEIRTPINAVLGMNEMILRESEDQDILAYSESIRTAGNTLLGIVNDILDFSKIEAGKMEIIPVDYDLSSVLSDLVNMVQTRAEDKGLLLKLDFDRSVPKLLHGDEVRIKQVVTNILTNAIKYTEKGSVTFKVGYERVSDDDILLNVAIKDTGIGIKPDDMAKLFSEFERIEEKRNRNIEGTGLGMNITQRLLEMMDSPLKVESVYGEGSTFSFSLRQSVVAWDELGDYEEAYRNLIQQRKVAETSFTAPDAKILVVDDTPMNLVVFKSLLKRTKVQIDTGASGDEGLTLSADNKYDIIFLDHMMPEKDGIETLHEMRERADDPNLDTPIICLTANAISGAREKYLDEGFDDYLTKPIDSAKLEEMMVNYLPKEKIQEAVDDGSSEANSESLDLPEVLDPLKDQDWIDMNVGITNSGDVDAYLSLLEIFYESLDEKMEEIEGFYAEEDWKNYTIKVHALKSSARLIGAAEFGEEAQLLENAGNDGDLDYIRAHQDAFMEKCRGFKIPLSEVFDTTDDASKPEADSELMTAAYEEIRAGAEEMDLDRLDNIFSEMKEYSIPDSDKELWDQLVKAAEMFDYDTITNLLQ